jgi:hypothetical protein
MVKQSRRAFLQAVSAAGGFALAPSQAMAEQAYPVKPLRWIVGFPPGGGADIRGDRARTMVVRQVGMRGVMNSTIPDAERQQYVDAQRALGVIRHKLQTAPLTLQQRSELELHAAKLAGVLLRPWLPVSRRGRLIMAGIVLLGLQQAWTGNYEPMIFWLLLPFFSPRIVGECAFLVGKVSRLLRS